MGEIPARWKGTCVEGLDFNSSNCNKYVSESHIVSGVLWRSCSIGLSFSSYSAMCLRPATLSSFQFNLPYFQPVLAPISSVQLQSVQKTRCTNPPHRDRLVFEMTDMEVITNFTQIK